MDSNTFIHPSAIIEEGSELGRGVYIGPFCFVGKQVKIRDRTVLKSHVVLSGFTEIGCDNQIYPFVSIGEVNQDLKYAGENTVVEIGNRNSIRESVTIHRGTMQGGGVTRLGNDNLLMVNTHIAHDCAIGNRVVFANNVTLGGHVQVGDYTIIGGLTAIHQRCVIGAHVMIGGCSGVVQDIPPYITAQGNHAVPYGINAEGLRRHGFNQDALRGVRKAYNILYRKGYSLKEAKVAITQLAEKYPEVVLFIDFFSHSTRGIVR